METKNNITEPLGGSTIQGALWKILLVSQTRAGIAILGNNWTPKQIINTNRDIAEITSAWAWRTALLPQDELIKEIFRSQISQDGDTPDEIEL